MIQTPFMRATKWLCSCVPTAQSPRILLLPMSLHTDTRRLTRRAAGVAARAVTRVLATHAWSRAPLNYLDSTLDRPDRAGSRATFYHLTAKQFRQRPASLAAGTWRARFAGRDLLLPLRADQASLDWDTAVATTGNEAPIKELYRRLLARNAVELFVDIGANRGTHSLLF